VIGTLIYNPKDGEFRTRKVRCSPT